MNKVLRVLLLAVLVLTIALPLSVSAESKPMLTVIGKIYNGTNGGPETPVTVSLFRDSGAGDELIREETFPGGPSHSFSEMGDFLFQTNCVPGYYTVQVDAFMEGGADAVGVAWWGGSGQTDVLLKRLNGEPGPFTYSWYADCGFDQEVSLTFEYSTVAGPRANAAWMYIGGKVFAPDGDPFQGADVRVCKIAYDETTNLADPTTVLEDYGIATSGDRGFYGMGLKREPGFYMVVLVNPGAAASANPLFFQVFDVFGTGGPGMGYGPGSSWLPWAFMQPEWVYSYFNFMVAPA